MLKITIPAREYWDEDNMEFITTKAVEISLEHSLVSISKWESKWHKPFLSKDEKTPEETIDYIKCMTLTQNVEPDIYLRLTQDNLNKIQEYITDPYSATVIYEDPHGPRSREIITSELIYYWMVALQIPVEFQKWHLNRLLTLIRICNIKNKPPKKMSQNEIMRRNSALNAARRQKLHSKG